MGSCYIKHYAAAGSVRYIADGTATHCYKPWDHAINHWVTAKHSGKCLTPRQSTCTHACLVQAIKVTQSWAITHTGVDHVRSLCSCCLDCLEDVHSSFNFDPLNFTHTGDEHTTARHAITEGKEKSILNTQTQQHNTQYILYCNSVFNNAKYYTNR